MKCWGKTRDKGSCRRSATTWCLLSNVRYAMCDRHAAANQGKRLHPMGSGNPVRSSAR